MIFSIFYNNLFEPTDAFLINQGEFHPWDSFLTSERLPYKKENFKLALELQQKLCK